MYNHDADLFEYSCHCYWQSFCPKRHLRLFRAECGCILSVLLLMQKKEIYFRKSFVLWPNVNCYSHVVWIFPAFFELPSSYFERFDHLLELLSWPLYFWSHCVENRNQNGNDWVSLCGLVLRISSWARAEISWTSWTNRQRAKTSINARDKNIRRSFIMIDQNLINSTLWIKIYFWC